MESILYVDDELINLKLFELNFRDKYHIITTTSPLEAINIIEKQDIKLVISDFKMPVLNGMQLIEKIKVLKPQIVCFILSGYLESEVVTDKSKVFRYIMKPYNKASVLSDIENGFAHYSDSLS